jgi:hypothetical protein
MTMAVLTHIAALRKNRVIVCMEFFVSNIPSIYQETGGISIRKDKKR